MGCAPHPGYLWAPQGTHTMLGRSSWGKEGLVPSITEGEGMAASPGDEGSWICPQSLRPTWCCRGRSWGPRRLLPRHQDLVPGWRWSSHSPVCLSPHFCAPLQVTVCWVEEVPASNGQSLSPQAEHAGIRTYFFSAENTEEQESWIQAMGEAARVQIPPTQRSEHCTGLGAPLCLLELGWRGPCATDGTSWSTRTLRRTELGEHQPPEAAGGMGNCWHAGGVAGGG